MAMTGSFTEMRHDRDRTWYRRSDLVDAAAKAGVRLTADQVRHIIKKLPRPANRAYGHWHYDQSHMDAVLAAVEALR